MSSPGYQSRVEAVTKADVDRVARAVHHAGNHDDPGRGRSVPVEGPLKSLPFVEAIHPIDSEGKPLAAPAPAGNSAAPSNR